VFTALESMIMELEPHSDMQIKLTYYLENLPLTPREEIHLMQIAREAAQNAVKHSGGSQLVISIYDENGEVFLDVWDDGTSHDLNSKKDDHFGLVFMTERSRKLNGQLTFDTPTQSGTHVLFHFHPVNTSAVAIREEP